MYLSECQGTSWAVWLNGWVFVYKLCVCGFEPRCSQFNKNPSKQTKFSIFIANKTDRFTLKRVGNMIN